MYTTKVVEFKKKIAKKFSIYSLVISVNHLAYAM